MAADRIVTTSASFNLDVPAEFRSFVPENLFERLFARNQELFNFVRNHSEIQTKSARKLFTIGDNIGINMGQAMYTNNRVPVSVLLDWFCRSNTFDKPKEAAEKLLSYLHGVDGNMDTTLMLAGYDKSDPENLLGYVFRIDVKDNEVEPLSNLAFQYAGANDYFKQYCEKINQNTQLCRYTLQDAADICKLAIDTCRKFERYFDFKEAITESIEMIAITHSGIQWLRKAELEVR